MDFSSSCIREVSIEGGRGGVQCRSVGSTSSPIVKLLGEEIGEFVNLVVVMGTDVGAVL